MLNNPIQAEHIWAILSIENVIRGFASRLSIYIEETGSLM